MQEGQFMSPSDIDGSANVVALGSTVAEELFGGTGVDPIGQVVKVRNASQTSAGGIPLRVTGVITPRGSAFCQDQDDQIFLPLKIGEEKLLGIHYLQMIGVKVDSADNVDQTVLDVTNVLKQRHHIQSENDIDLTVRNQATAVDLLKTITNALSLFLTSMAAISLVVGGVGILNIMLATVAERTREIGLRKAVGATDGMVMRQFLLEAGTLTFLGGVAGIIIGVIVSYLMSVLMKHLGFDWEFVISITSVVLAISVSILTGVIFGLYPSFKASRLDPIEALRYE
jgi:putative ABC transport system permease protein